MKEFFKDFGKWFWRFSAIYFIIILLCLIKVDYYLYLPGNLTDIKDEISIKDNKKELDGSVSSVYVMTFTRPTLFSYLISKDLPYAFTYKMSSEEIESYDSNLDIAIGRFDSNQSFSNAELAAYSLKLKEDGDNSYYKQLTYIYSANSDIISNIKYTDLVGTMITGFLEHENTYPTINEVSEYLRNKGVNETAILYLKDNKNNEKTLEITKREKDGSALFGITIKTSFILNTDSFIDVENVYTTGPSGGAMHALYIYLMLEDENILKGRKIAGTGTIGYSLDNEGNVESFAKIGAIGCVEQKLYAAYIDNAEVFYCPSDNYDDCMKAYELYNLTEKDIRVVKVSYLDDIINDLKG